MRLLSTDLARLIAMLGLACLAGCGSARQPSSAAGSASRRQIYLHCETTANVARNVLGYGYNISPGHVGSVIAPAARHAAADLRQGAERIATLHTSAANRRYSQHLAAELTYFAAGLTRLSHQASESHRRKPTAVLRSFGAANFELRQICPASP